MGSSPPSRRAAQSSQQVHPNKRDMYNICSWTGYSRSHGQMHSYFEILEPLRSPTSRIDFFPTADRAHHSAHRAPHGCSRKGETACPTSQPVSPLHRTYTVYSTALIARETQDATWKFASAAQKPASPRLIGPSSSANLVHRPFHAPRLSPNRWQCVAASTNLSYSTGDCDPLKAIISTPT